MQVTFIDAAFVCLFLSLSLCKTASLTGTLDVLLEKTENASGLLNRGQEHYPQPISTDGTASSLVVIGVSLQS